MAMMTWLLFVVILASLYMLSHCEELSEDRFWLSQHDIWQGNNPAKHDTFSHNIRKREAPNPEGLNFTLIKYGYNANEYNLKAGDWVGHKLTVSAGTTGEYEVTITITGSTIDHSNRKWTIFSIVDAHIGASGANIENFVADNIVAVLDDEAGDGRYNKAVVYLGKFTRAANSALAADDNIVLQFEILVNYSPGYTDGDEYNVVLDVDYVTDTWTQTEVYYGSTTNVNLDSAIDPVVVLNGPAVLMKGTSGTWTLGVALNDGSNHVVVDVYLPLNESAVLGVCRISIASAGDSYAYLEQDDAAEFYTEDWNVETIHGGVHHIIASLDIGHIVNKKFWEGGSVATDNLIEVDIDVLLFNSSDVVEQADYYIGVSVEVDSEAIYSAQASFSALATELATGDNLPSVQIYAAHGTVLWGKPTTFYLNVTIPPDTSDTYYVEFGLPHEGASLMTFCDYMVTIYRVGNNFPCVAQFDLSASTFGTNLNGAAVDFLSVDLDFLTNTGQRSEALDNTIVIEFRALVADSHQIFSTGDNVSISAGVKIGVETIWVGEVLVTLGADPEAPTEEPEIKHSSAMNSRDASILYEGGSTTEIIAIRMPPSTMLRDVNITVKSSEIDKSPLLDFCKLEVYQLGSMFLDNCFADEVNYTAYNTSKRVSKTDNDATYEASLIINWIINGMYGNYWWNVNDTTLYILVNILATSHPGLVDGSDVTFDVFVDIGGPSIVNKTITLTYETTDPVSIAADDDPAISLAYNEMNSVNVRGVVAQDLAIYTTPRTISKFSVQARTDVNSPISICRIAVKEVAGNVSCIKHDYQHGYTYGAYFGSNRDTECMTDDEANGDCIQTVYDLATLDLGNVASFGQSARDQTTQDGTLIEIQIHAKFHENMTAGVRSGDQASYTVQVFEGSSTIFTDTATLILNPDQEAGSSEDLPEFTLEKYNTESKIVRGGGALYVVRAYAPQYSTYSYYAEVYSPLNTTADRSKAGIGDVSIITAGWNLPCLNDKHIDKTYQSTDVDGATNDMAIIRLGKVANSAIPFPSVPVNDTDNMFTMEIAVCVPSDSPATYLETLSTSIALQVDSQQIWTSALDYDVSDEVLLSETGGYVELAFSENYTETTLKFGDTVRRSIDIYTDMLTDDIGVSLELASDGSAETLMTVSRVHISSIGRNLPCNKDLEGSLVAVDGESTYYGSQDDLVEARFGVVSNLGTSIRYQFEPYSPGDDVIQLTYFVTASQHVLNSDPTTVSQEYIIYLERGRDTIWDVNLTETITIDSHSYTPTPDMQLLIDLEELAEDSSRNPGDTFSVDIRFNHTDGSTGHAFDAQLKIFAPHFIRYDAHEGLSLINFTQMSINDEDENSVTFQMSEIYFSDNQTLTVNYTIDPDSVLDRGQDIHVVMPVNLFYYGKDGSETTTSAVLDTMSILEFDIEVPDCTDTLGMENGTITDCLITWSSALEDFNGTKARLNSDAAWKPGYRGEPFLGEEYLKIQLANVIRITGVTIQAPAGTTDWVVTFKLQYSHYGYQWFTVQDAEGDDRIFDITNDIPAATTVDGVVFVPLTGSEVFEARFMRFIPMSNSNNNNIHGVRLEIHGCVITQDMSSGSCEEMEAAAEERSIYERGWLMDTTHGHLYVCILADIDDYVSCSHTSDFGASWESIDEEIININFLRPDTNELYGLARNQLGLMRSDDWGDTWWSVSETEYTIAESHAQVITVKRLPFEDWTLSSLDNLNAEFGFDLNSTVRWTVSMDGVSKMDGGSWTLVSYWSTEEWDFT